MSYVIKDVWRESKSCYRMVYDIGVPDSPYTRFHIEAVLGKCCGMNALSHIMDKTCLTDKSQFEELVTFLKVFGSAECAKYAPNLEHRSFIINNRTWGMKLFTLFVNQTFTGAQVLQGDPRITKVFSFVNHAHGGHLIDQYLIDTTK